MSDLLQKLQLLYASGTHITPENAKAIAEFLYEALTVLDRKATALMAFDGILVAAASFTAEKKNVVSTERVFTLIVTSMALVAAGFCLFVSQISYPFLDKVASAPGALDYSNELKALESALIWRTYFYQAAWWLSLFALPLFLIMFATSLRRRNKTKK